MFLYPNNLSTQALARQANTIAYVMQEKQQKERWGKDPAYQAWRQRTNLLVPLPKLWSGPLCIRQQPAMVVQEHASQVGLQLNAADTC